MQRVLMLVNNDWKIDSRVVREASALAAQGHEVHVISRTDVPSISSVIQAQVTFHSVPLVSKHRSALSRAVGVLAAHVGVIRETRDLAGGARIRLHAWLAAMAAVMAALLFLLLSPVLIPVGLALLLARRLYRKDQSHQTLGRFRPAAKINGWTFGFAKWAYALFVTQPTRMLLAEHVIYLNQFGLDATEFGVKLAPDVVHSHDLVTLSTGRAISRRLGCPLVYDAHELETHTNYWGLAPATQKWIAIYEKTLIRRTSAVITVCDSIADWLRDNYAIARPVVVLNSPEMQTAPALEPSRDLRHSLGISAQTPLAVYVGAVSIDRGLVHCVRATALVPGLHFAFVGPRYSVTEAEILSTATELGISDRIHLVDPVPSREVAGFVCSADVSVIAIQNVCLSYYYCFPNKLLESVVGGVPVAVARLVELERFVGKFGVGVTMDETDPRSIASAIHEVVSDGDRYKPSDATREAIRLEYGWGAQQARLQGLYATLGG